MRLLFFAILAANSVFGQNFRTTCDHQLLSPDVTAATHHDVIRRGKMGARGQKGERGQVGPKGDDQSEAVSRNAEGISRHSALLIGYKEKFAEMSAVISRQGEIIENFTRVFEEHSALIANLSLLVEGLSLFKYLK